MRRNCFFLALLLMAYTCPAQVDSVTQRFFLIGDAGELVGNGHPVVDWLKKNVNWNDPNNTAIYLGDNIYPLGLPMEGESDYERSKKVLDYEISLVKGKKAKSFFIPGNHDWKNGKLGGWQQVRNQHNYINGLAQENIQSLPLEGCPGPIAIEMNPQVVVVFIDSQWFMYIHEKPGPESSCPARSVQEFQTELREIVASHPNQLMIVVTHHPVYSFGVHGGDYTWKEHLFPFTAVNKNLWIPMPVIGSIYPLSRGVFGNLQDVNHPLYQTMVKAIEDEVKEHPNVIIASGHDHSLQLIQKDSLFQIVSGSASNLSRVKENRAGRLLFRDLTHGFSMVELRKSGRVQTFFYNTASKDLNDPTFTKEMRKIEAPPMIISKDSIPILSDSFTVAANRRLKGTGFKNFLFGGNYRAEWTTPVTVPVFNIATEYGGLTPEKQGGGKQTRSLRLKDKTGKEWVLRTVEKYPDAAIPPDLRQTFVKDIVEDGISAAYPFAGLSVGPLARAAGIPYLKRKLVYVPDDPRLGRFRAAFKNSLATLEEREPDTISKTFNTDEVILKMAKDNDDHVDQLSVLKARILDNFYMDFDRHEDQWRWATRDTGKGKIYYAIPKDQDQAFFVNQGLIPKFIKKPWLLPPLQGFEAETDNINTFNKTARNFDRFFLNELSQEVWSREVDSFLTRMTDVVIEDAINQQPKETRGFHFASITRKLKERRKSFKNDLMDYYEFLSKEVNIVGSNQRELFTIDQQDNKVNVTVHKIDKDNNISSKIYERLFDADVTKELRIYGLEDNDSFVVRGGRRSIKIRLVGGPGKDHFNNQATGASARVYDVEFEQNEFSGNASGIRKRISQDPRNNEYNRLSYNYGYVKPNLLIGYNIDDGMFLGMQTQVITHGFRKDPFKAQHNIAAGHALRTSSYFFRYEGIFTKAIGINDMVIRGELRAPVNVTNFFGLGNNTTYTTNHSNQIRYYRAVYSRADLALLLRRHLQSWMRVYYGPAFQYFHMRERENANRFLGSNNNGLNKADLYDRKTFAGAQFLVDINSKNNANVPTRGFILDAGAKQYFGLNNSSNSITQLHWDMSVFASFKPQPKTVYAVRLGAGHNIGSFEVPQAQYLSGTSNLRGYRRDRFAGRTMLFLNAEIRMKLADFTTYLFPGSIGITLFNDVGRVWSDRENSRRWHTGYGGGIWLSPIKRWVLSVTAATSKEEKILPYVSFGFRF